MSASASWQPGLPPVIWQPCAHLQASLEVFVGDSLEYSLLAHRPQIGREQGAFARQSPTQGMPGLQGPTRHQQTRLTSQQLLDGVVPTENVVRALL